MVLKTKVSAMKTPTRPSLAGAIQILLILLIAGMIFLFWQGYSKATHSVHQHQTQRTVILETALRNAVETSPRSFEAWHGLLGTVRLFILWVPDTPHAGIGCAQQQDGSLQALHLVKDTDGLIRHTNQTASTEQHRLCTVFLSPSSRTRTP